MNKKYIEILRQHESEIRTEFAAGWQAIGEYSLTPQQAQHVLDLLYRRSMLDIIQHLPRYAQYYPAKQGYRRRLEHVNSLWWVDHATAGISGWGTLGWFSNAPREHTKKFTELLAARDYAKRRKTQVTQKNGKFYVSWKGYANAITHFVVFRDGTPFMLLPLEDGCWGEPKRNGDAIQVEMVNPLVVHPTKIGWRFWAGKLPDEIVRSQPPVMLDKPFRGATHMVPYTREQFIANIKLKRLCIAATTTDDGTTRMSSERMSQHTDWRDSKFDMGPLWPFDAVNQAAFEPYPIEEYDFVRVDVKTSDKELEEAYDETTLLSHVADDSKHEHDVWDRDETIDTAKEIQQALMQLYGPRALPEYGDDGHLGNETTLAVWHFQGDWNRNHPKDRIKEDGIPGVMTCARLVLALSQAQFKLTPF